MCLSCDHVAQKRPGPARGDRNGERFEKSPNKSYPGTHICIRVYFLGKLYNQFESPIKYLIHVVSAREHILIITAELI